MLAPRKCLYQKEATGMERPEMYSVIRCNNPTCLCGAVKVPRLEGGSIGPSTESCINCDALFSMVWCLHQGNIYIKRKVRVWRDQKYIPLVGGITPPNCAGRHNTPSRGRQYRAQKGKFGKLGRTYGHGTVLAPRKYLYQKELRV